MTDQPNKWSMPRFLSGAADVIHMNRPDFNALYEEIRAAEKMLRVSDDEVAKAEMGLSEAQQTRATRMEDLTELRQRWYDESTRLGVISGGENG